MRTAAVRRAEVAPEIAGEPGQEQIRSSCVEQQSNLLITLAGAIVATSNRSVTS
ncbi:MAG TPA: hypothetical protein VES20_14385 [Bryobacteraceae bacterium]|nr:hypothetical protein [Bryobacteraceae bacterium]